VELSKDKVQPGKFEFGAEYGGCVFVFDNENNLNAFLETPRKYLQTLPKLPKKTNIAIIGPKKSGKKTLAKLL
jgi:YHS domain-containing protein